MAGMMGGAAPTDLVSSHPEVNIPAAQLGDPVPYLFGTYDMLGTVIYPASASDMISTQSSSGSGGKGGFGGGTPTGSSVWYMNFAIVYCCNLVQKILRVKVDDNTIWGASDMSSAVDNSVAQIGYGYVELPNAQLKGTIRFYFGLPSQAVDPFFIYHAIPAGQNIDLTQVTTSIQMPSWPNYCYAMYVNFQVGTSPSVPKLHIRCEAAPIGSVIDGVPINPNFPLDTSYGVAQVFTGTFNEANPAYVIADLLTHPRYGCGMPGLRLVCDSNAQLDGSFEGVAQQLYNEGIGISGYLDKQDKSEEVINDIMTDVGAQLVRRGTQWGIRLIRRHYSYAVPDPVTITEDHFTEPPIINPVSITSVINQLWVEYKDQTREYSDTPIQLPNVSSALSLSTTTNQRSDRLTLKYVTERNTALQIGNFRAPFIVSPPDTIKVKIDRPAGLLLEVGDRILPIHSKVQNGSLDGSRIFRLTKVARPKAGAYVEAEAYEEYLIEIFGDVLIPAPVTPPAPGSGSVANTPFPDQAPIELPWDLAGQSDTMLLTYLADRAQLTYQAFSLWGRIDTGATSPDYSLISSGGAFVQGGVLAQAYPLTTPAFDGDGFYFTPGNPLDMAAFWIDQSVQLDGVYNLQRLGVLVDPVTGCHEFFGWQIIEPAQGGQYNVQGVIRGLFDTDPLAHPAGRTVFLMDAVIPFTVARQGGWGNQVLLDLKAVPYNAVDTADVSAMPTLNVTLAERATRPFPVTNLRVNGIGAAYGPTYTASSDVVIDWIPRTRGKGIGYNTNPQGPFDPVIAIESTFVIRIYNGPTLVRTYTSPATTPVTDGWGVSRTTFTYPGATVAADGNLSSFIVKVTSVVNGWESLLIREATVSQL